MTDLAPVSYNTTTGNLQYDNGSGYTTIPVGGGSGLIAFVDCGNYAQTQTGLTSAITAAGAGGTIILKGSYTLSSQLVFPDNFTVLGNATFDCSALTGKAIVLGSRFRWYGRMEAFGSGNISGDSSKILISCAGTNNTPSAPTYKIGPMITELVLHDVPGQCILLEYVQDYYIGREECYNYGYSGHIDISCKRGVIVTQHCYGTVPGEAGNAYCYSATRYYGTLTAYPRTSDITILDATYEDNFWHGFDTHAGQNITILKLRVINCKQAISIVPSQDVTAYVFAAHNIVINNVNIDSPYSTSETEALFISGAMNGTTVVEQATGIVVNGGQSLGYGMASQDTGSWSLQGAEARMNGILVDQAKLNSVFVSYGSELRLHDCVLRDPHDPTLDPSYIRILGNNNTVHISGGTQFQRKNTGIDTKVGKYAINQGTGTGNIVNYGWDTRDESQSGNTGTIQGGTLCAFRAYRSAGNYTANTNPIIYSTEALDIGNNFDTSNGRFTAPVKGRYEININSNLKAGTGGGDANVYVQVNGSTIGLTISTQDTVLKPYSLSGILALNAGDYVDMFYQGSGTGHTYYGTSASYNGFSMHLIG